MSKTILDVPKVKQLKNYCGPASLSMVFAYYGLKLSQEEIAEEITEIWPHYVKKPIMESGLHTTHLTGYAREKGFSARRYKQCSLDRLINYLKKEVPTIALIDDFTDRDIGHFIVVKGYDLDKKLLYLNDPYDQRRTKASFKFFKKLWLLKSDEREQIFNEIVPIQPKHSLNISRKS